MNKIILIRIHTIIMIRKDLMLVKGTCISLNHLQKKFIHHILKKMKISAKVNKIKKIEKE